jgi:hypothetical protein
MRKTVRHQRGMVSAIRMGSLSAIAGILTQHPEHQSMKDHCGGKFDPREVDPMQAQERLDGISI